EAVMPALPVFVVRDLQPPYGGKRLREGFSLDLTVRVSQSGYALLAKNQGADGSGIQLEWTPDATLRIRMSDAQTEVTWESDPISAGVGEFRFTINVDGG